ncbi:MAG: hypothetical protein ABH825_03235, partial [Candidatus Omnitrophota bacterium]
MLIYEYSDRLYDSSGRITSYTRTDRDADGSTKAIYEYSGYEYDAAGRTVRYTQANKDANGALTGSYEYTDRTF